MIDFLEKLIKEKLKPPWLPGAQHWEDTLAPKPADGGKPRSIVVQFLQYRTKEEILRKAWEKEIYINAQRIYFDHDYLAAILNRRKEYNEAKQILRENKIRFQTPYPFKLRVFYEDGTRVYQTAHEATKDMRDRGFVVRMVPPQQNLKELLESESRHVAGRRGTDLHESSGGLAATVSKLQAFSRIPPHRREMVKVILFFVAVFVFSL